MNDIHLIPLGIAFVVFVNSFMIFNLLDLMFPLYSMNGEHLTNQVIFELRANYWRFFGWLVLFASLPPIFTFGGTWSLLYSWKFYCRSGRGQAQSWRHPFRAVIYGIGDVAGRILVNYMAQLTAHDERTSALMVDILDDNDTLYSGLYSEYHMEDGKLASISLTNVICFGFKSEKARKEARLAFDGADGQDPLPYILPNQGQMCFPISNVQNFHFWRIVQKRNFKFPIDSPRNQVMLAWYAALKYAVPRLNLAVTALVADPSEDVTIFLKLINRLGLSLDLIDLERVSSGPDNGNDDDKSTTHDLSSPPSSSTAR